MDFDKWHCFQALEILPFFNTFSLIDLNLFLSCFFLLTAPYFCWKLTPTDLNVFNWQTIVPKSHPIRCDLCIVSHKRTYILNISLKYQARIDWPPTKCMHARKKTELSGNLNIVCTQA